MNRIKFLILFFLISISSFSQNQKNKRVSDEGVIDTEVVNPSKVERSEGVNKTSDNFSSELECFKFLDQAVKECNGMLVSKKNFRQLSASFTSKGYAAFTDEVIVSQSEVNLHKTWDIKWANVTRVCSKDMTFQYSCICVSFADGFAPNRIWYSDALTSKRIAEIDDPMRYDNTNFGQVGSYTYYNHYSRLRSKEFSFIVKKDKAYKCEQIILKLRELAIAKRKNNNQDILTKHEKWSGDYLNTYYTDSKGNIQGRVETRDEDGKLVEYGNVRDNVRVGEWYIKGTTKIYKGYNDGQSFGCGCDGYH